MAEARRSSNTGYNRVKMVNAGWVRAEQECVAHGNPQPLISWQIQVKMGFKIGGVLGL